MTNQIYQLIQQKPGITEAQIAKALTQGRLLAVRPAIQSLIWGGWIVGNRYTGYKAIK
jgi:hypothetical protein